MPPLRSRILALILAAVAAFAWWKRPVVEPGDSASAEPRERRPDYTVDRFSGTVMDDAGVPERRLTARELRHYPDDDSTELEQPLLTLFEEAAPPWLVRSNTGWISGDGAEVLMRGKVYIDREPASSIRPVHLTTRELLVRPDEEYAETDRPIIGTSQSDWLTSANGGRIWFGEALRIELDGPVRARFVSDGNAGKSISNPMEDTP